MKIVDNYLSEYHANSIDTFFHGLMWHSNEAFPWHFVDQLNGHDLPYNYYFAHELINQGQVLSNPMVGNQPSFNIFFPIIDKMGMSWESIWRLKVNLYPRTQSRVHHSTHRDYNPGEGGQTLLYYVNTNDGLTVFDEKDRKKKRFNKQTIRSVKNRAAFFDGSNKHHSTTPTNCNYRVTINFDWK